MQPAKKRKAKVIDLDYRPATYWTKKSDLQTFVARILGEERRQHAEQLLMEGRFFEVEAWLMESKLDERTRQILARAHPRFMSGEFLPEFLPNETEIVRIRLESVTGDVTSIRARWADSSIHYRIVDEYDTVYAITPSASDRPLTLREIVALIDSAEVAEEDTTGLIDRMMKPSLDYGCSPSELRSFIHIRSPFYRQLSVIYADRIRRMVDEHMESRLDPDDEPIVLRGMAESADAAAPPKPSATREPAPVGPRLPQWIADADENVALTPQAIAAAARKPVKSRPIRTEGATTRKRFAIIPGGVEIAPGKWRSFGEAELMQLYGVDPAECAVIDTPDDFFRYSHLIQLRPRPAGDYAAYLAAALKSDRRKP